MKRLLRVAGAVLALTVATVAHAEPYKLTLCTASVGGTWNLIGSGIDAAMKKSFPGSTVTVQSSAGGIANAKTLTEGGCDFAIMHAPEIALAVRGEEPFTAPIDTLRVAARVENWSPLHFMLTREFAEQYGIKTVDDIARVKPPLRIVLQKRGNIGHAVAKYVLEQSGITFEDIEAWGGKVLYGASSDQMEWIQDHRADAGMNVLFPGASQVTELAQSVPIVLVAISPEVAQKTAEAWNVDQFTIAKDIYAFSPVDITTVTLGAHLVTLSTTPAQTVTDVLTAITDNVDLIATVHPSMKRMDIAAYPTAAKGLPYHDAAKAFYEGRGTPVTN